MFGSGVGSGGSIQVLIDFFIGFGIFRVSGGDVNFLVGVGGGGRIGIIVFNG